MDELEAVAKEKPAKQSSRSSSIELTPIRSEQGEKVVRFRLVVLIPQRNKVEAVISARQVRKFVASLKMRDNRVRFPGGSLTGSFEERLKVARYLTNVLVQSEE